MKRLNREAFERARQFLKTQARPLERAIFERRFEDGPSDRVIEELARFQNDDGGFGQALEPDLRTPSSSALATGIALHTLKELACQPDHSMVRGAVQFLLATFDKHTQVWRVAPHDVNSYPHAGWWHDEGGSLARTFQGYQIIPRAEIVGLLHHYSSLVPADWLNHVTGHTVTAIETMADESFGGGGDALSCALSLAETENLPQSFKQRLAPRLRALTLSVVSRNPQEWDSYCAPPLKVAPSPQSIVANLLRDDIQVHLDYVIDHQTQAGAWEPVWTWEQLYPEAWVQARREWRGILTLDALTVLHAYGRIEE